MMKPGKKFRQ